MGLGMSVRGFFVHTHCCVRCEGASATYDHWLTDSDWPRGKGRVSSDRLPRSDPQPFPRMVGSELHAVTMGRLGLINPLKTAVPVWGQTAQVSSTLPPKRDCGTKTDVRNRLRLASGLRYYSCGTKWVKASVRVTLRVTCIYSSPTQ